MPDDRSRMSCEQIRFVWPPIFSEIRCSNCGEDLKRRVIDSYEHGRKCALSLRCLDLALLDRYILGIRSLLDRSSADVPGCAFNFVRGVYQGLIALQLHPEAAHNIADQAQSPSTTQDRVASGDVSA